MAALVGYVLKEEHDVVEHAEICDVSALIRLGLYDVEHLTVELVRGLTVRITSKQLPDVALLQGLDIDVQLGLKDKDSTGVSFLFRPPDDRKGLSGGQNPSHKIRARCHIRRVAACRQLPVRLPC